MFHTELPRSTLSYRGPLSNEYKEGWTFRKMNKKSGNDFITARPRTTYFVPSRSLALGPTNLFQVSNSRNHDDAGVFNENSQLSNMNN